MLQYRSTSFKYLDPQRPVYVLTAARSVPFPLTRLALYTTPFQPRERGETMNVLVGFECKELLFGYAREHGLVGDVEVGPLEIWKDVSRMMHLPLVVVLREYMDLVDRGVHADVFFFQTREAYEESLLTRKIDQ